MGKESKSQKNDKSAPTWRQKLAEFDINSIYEGRTCEIIIMAELTIHFSEVNTLFHSGAQSNPTSVVKSINFESFINDIEQPNAGQAKSKPEISKSKGKGDPHAALLQSATAEAAEFLNTGQAIPAELTSQLLKLKIINKINEDVTLRDEERRLEIERLEAEEAAKNAANKEKAEMGKEKKEKKEKPEKKGKGKSGPAKLPVEERPLYFIINGFYEPDLAQQLWNVGAPLSAILELSSPDCVFKDKLTSSGETPGSSLRTLSDTLDMNAGGEEFDEELVLFVNQYYESKESVLFSSYLGEQSTASISSLIQNRLSVLHNFWSKIYEQLEGELQANCLERAAHMKLNPFARIEADKNPDNVFFEIRKEILKIPDVKRQHLNYLNNIKICDVEVEPKEVTMGSLKTYRNLIDVVPLDCFTIGLFLHCLVEEVCTRVPDPKPRSMKSNLKSTEPSHLKPAESSQCHKESLTMFTKPSSSPEIVKFPAEENIPAEPEDESEEKNLKQLANYVIQFRKTHSPLGRTAVTYHQNKFNPKFSLKMSKELFTIHETSRLEYKFNSYRQLSKDLLQINLNIFKKCPPFLLWNLYAHLETIEVIYRKHHLQTWSRILNLSTDEISYALNVIGFNKLTCSAPSKSAVEVKTSLQMLFPGKNEFQVLEVALPKVKYIQTPDISLTTLTESESCIKIPSVAYSTIPNIYESTNIPTYLWYEKLPPVVMIQQLEKANSEYVCVDHKYCPYTDAITLRYHNDVDAFGINSRTWNQSLRTPVCFRDFCKYVLHEEAHWLEKEEYDYQEKLKKLHRSRAKELQNEEANTGLKGEENEKKKINEEEMKNKKVSIDSTPEMEQNHTSKNKLSMFCAKPGELYNFLAYDLSEARLQLTGATTIFHSLDGYKIIVDRANFIGKPSKLSLNVAVAGHNFILHYTKTTLKQPLMFHFCLNDSTIIVFTKSPKTNKPEISIAEKNKILHSRKKSDAETAYQPREKDVYYVTETKWYSLTYVGRPAVARRSMLLPEDFMMEFLRQIRKTFAVPIRLKKKRKRRQSESLRVNYETPNAPRNSKDLLSSHRASTEKKFSRMTSLEVAKFLTAQTECRNVLEKIKEAKTIQIPRFKVYSSKLHKFEYVKRAKSYIHIKIGKHTIPLLCQHPRYKTSRDLEVVKVFPVKLTDSAFHNNNNYNMKMSLPSGLLIYTISGANNKPFNIKQKYIEKGPQCKSIVNEDSRTFMRDGRVVIKKSDGTLDIFSVTGQIIHCEIPHSTVKTYTKYRTKRNQKTNWDQTKKLSKLESKLHRIVNWRRRHIIGGAETRYFKFRRINLRHQKLEAKKCKQIYVVQEGTHPLFEYTLITHDGKQLKVTDTNIKKQNNIFQSMHEDKPYQEYMNVRDDGTITLLYGGGILTTQFVDNTRISSWFSEAAEPVWLEQEEEECFFEGESISSLDFFEAGGWVFIEIFYRFEHPNYATVLLNSNNCETEIDLPNGVVMNVTENEHYFMNIGGVMSSVVNEELVYVESRSCDRCMQRNITVINTRPLYDGTDPIADNTELLKTCDSYEKVFLVNYNGKCYRNSNYVRLRANRAECYQHDKEDHQQLFVLNRDLSGSKFWDVKAYRRRMREAASNNDTVVQYYGTNSTTEDYSSLEIRTYRYKPHHMTYVNRNLLNRLMLSTYHVHPNPPLHAYTTICHIYSMPKQCMTELLKASLVEINKTVEFPKADSETTLCKCISQISRENLKLKEKSVFDEHFKATTSALSLYKRWYAWHDLNKPYIPPEADQACTCKPKPHQEPKKMEPLTIYKKDFDLEPTPSLEILPDRVSSKSIIETPYKIHSSTCKCHIPADLACECKPTDKSFEDETELFETEMRVESFGEAELEAKERILSIKGWSYEVNFLDDYYVLAEQSLSASDFGAASVSDTVVVPQKTMKPPRCECNTNKKLNQKFIAPRKICTEDSCKRQKRPMTSIAEIIGESTTSLNSGFYKRQAGGEDTVVLPKKPLKPPSCKRNTDKTKLNQKLPTLKKICAEDRCKRQKRPITSTAEIIGESTTSLNSEFYKRQAGGEDTMVLPKKPLKPPSCKRNTDKKKLNQKFIAPRKIVAEDNCKRQKRPMTSIEEIIDESTTTLNTNEFYERQAGGEDTMVLPKKPLKPPSCKRNTDKKKLNQKFIPPRKICVEDRCKMQNRPMTSIEEIIEESTTTLNNEFYEQQTGGEDTVVLPNEPLKPPSCKYNTDKKNFNQKFIAPRKIFAEDNCKRQKCPMTSIEEIIEENTTTLNNEVCERQVGGEATVVLPKEPLKPPSYKYNTDKKKLNQNFTTPRKLFAEDDCQRQNRPMTSIEESATTCNNEFYERQAGDEDFPQKYSNVEDSEATTNMQKRTLLKKLHKRILHLVLITPEDASAETTKQYKIATANDIINNISERQLNVSELLKLLKMLNNVDVIKCSKLSLKELSCLILSLIKNKTKYDVHKLTATSNSASEFLSQVHILTNKQNKSKDIKSAVKAGEPLKREQKNIDESKLQPKKRVLDKIKNKMKNDDKMERFTKNIHSLACKHKKI